MVLVAAWARAFVLTCVVELLVAVPLLRARASAPRRAALVLFAQLASHPLVWFVFPELLPGRVSFLVVAELWAVAIETAFYRLAFTELPWTAALGIAALANGASLATGLLLRL